MVPQISERHIVIHTVKKDRLPNDPLHIISLMDKSIPPHA